MEPKELIARAIAAMDRAYVPYSAFFRAVFDGEREFTAIAVCGGKDGIIRDYFPPCGICRQVMREFCEDDFRIYMVGKDGVYLERTLNEILPDSFRPKDHMQE